ncbi:protein hypA [Lachnospiraceae bacterium KM106-2]|nr:protein hypA [Lachnospiraceae bacterium KM106-2]
MSKNIKSSKELRPMDAYELVKEEQLEDLKTLGLVFRHKKTGARVIVMSNDDDNKVFSIAFRTPPKDDTGVAHIIEHTVLCGSKEFPSKDPFVELVKGSLNTFLNAMTYSDKTMYPVASVNDKDFQNLMHVYMDAVFYPNIYKKEEIFKQEGWHYELENEEDPVTYNGVVYNEMKGVFSSPEQLLFRMIQNSVFPDTTYGVESGGNPESIPELTYEQYLDFHRKYYHPSNSYIYLYGDLDIEEKLAWMDEKYLSNFEYQAVDSTIESQEPFNKMREVSTYYSVTEEENSEDKTYLAYNAVIGTSLDRELYLAFQVLEYVLLTTPGAVLKQELVNAGIGKDIFGSYDNGIKQPIFSIIAKNTSENKKEEFIRIIRDTLKRIVRNGLDKSALQAAINYYEFKYREADFGQWPKGLMYNIQIFDSWLYDDEKPFIHIEANDTFAFLKEKVETHYFEDLIEKYLLQNTHTSLVIEKPMVGLTTVMEEATKERLEEYKASLNKEQIKQLIEDTKALKKFQETPSAKEEIEAIPMLKREDIGKDAMKLVNEMREIDGTKVLFHNIYTNGISYLKLCFDVGSVKKELIPYMSLLTSVLGYIDTKQHSYSRFNNEVNIHTGGISSEVNLYAKGGVPNEYVVKFEVRTKALYNKLGKAMELIKEMLFSTKIDDEKRLKEIIAELRSRLGMKITANGHSVAVNRAMSYYSKNAYFNDLIGGVEYYHFIEDLDDSFDDKKEEIIASLQEVLSTIFVKNTLLVSYTADEQGYDCLTKELVNFTKDLKVQAEDLVKTDLHPECKNEGFKTSSQVQYVARAGNFISAGLKYTGALKILRVALSYDYFWINIRVKGGAYGCMSGFSMDGNGYFTSYRDPKLAETDEVYAKTEDYVANFTVEERDMTKYIIGAISSMDTPLTPSAKGNRSLSAYLSGVTQEDLQRERDEVLHATQEDMRNLAPIVKAVYDAGNICVIGNETRIDEQKELFKTVENLK